MDQDTAAGPVPGRGLPGPVDGTDTGHELEDRVFAITSETGDSGSTGSSCWTRTSRASGRSLGYHSYGDPWREQRYWGD
jgi:hypothetical protein